MPCSRTCPVGASREREIWRAVRRARRWGRCRTVVVAAGALIWVRGPGGSWQGGGGLPVRARPQLGFRVRHLAWRRGPDPDGSRIVATSTPVSYSFPDRDPRAARILQVRALASISAPPLPPQP